MKSFLITVIIIFYSSLGLCQQSKQEKVDLIWNFGKKNIYPKSLSTKFTQSKYQEIINKLESNKVLTVAEAMNPFLKSLKISHTYVYDKSEFGYYFLRSLFSTKNLKTPKTVTIGAQLEKIPQGLRVKAVLNGLNAEKAGLKKEDIIISVNQTKPKDVSVFKSFAGKKINLSVLSNGTLSQISLKPISASIHESLLWATKNSIKIHSYQNRKIGYIRLWAGTDTKFLEVLRNAVLNRLKNTDGLVLDLRDGYGGAWWDYLDPFFQNTEDYFIAKTIDRSGKESLLKPERKENLDFYRKPMVVLINENVRSGKEALAYQFKKSKRALLIGTKTEGAFTGGLGGFSDKDFDFIFYLSSFEIFLDNNKIERVGITPDIKVPYVSGAKEDNQLQRALKEIYQQIK